MASQQATKSSQPKLEVRLRSVQALKDAMAFNRLTIAGLAVACGNPRYKSTIGHLHSGARNNCSPSLARRIEESLRLYPNALFELRMTTGSPDTTPQRSTSRGTKAPRTTSAEPLHDSRRGRN